MKKYIEFSLMILLLIVLNTNCLSDPDNTYNIIKDTLIARGDMSFAPWEFINDDGEPDGFNIALLKAIAKEAGLHVKISLGPWIEVRHQLEEGQIDLITGMVYSEKRKEKVEFSIPFAKYSHAIFVRKDSDISNYNDLRDKKVLVEHGDIAHDYILENPITNKIIPVTSQHDALRKLASGEYDAALLGKYAGLYNIDKLGLENIKATKQSVLPMNYCIAVQKNNHDLLNTLNQGLSNLQQTGRYEELYLEWFGEFDEIDLIEEYKEVIYFVIMLIGILFMGFLWSISLKIKVNKKTAELKAEINAKTEAERALRESEEKYRNLIQNSNDGIFLMYGERFEMVNKRFEEVTGYSRDEILSEDFNMMKIVSEKSRKDMEERRQKVSRGQKIPLNYAFIAVNKEGEELEIDASVAYIAHKNGLVTQGVFRDVTESKKLLAKVNQMQKMESIGNLAGGIAHDFNNLLTVINGNAEMLMMSMNEEHPDYQSLEDILAAGRKASDLTHKLLAFSRKQEFSPKLIDMNYIVSGLEKILRRLISEDITLKTHLSEKKMPVKADPSQLEQVIMNLVVNARDAINEKGESKEKKRISIETSSVFLDEIYTALRPDAIPGNYVLLSVADTGPGIPEECIDHIFEPFFTTKEEGRGTGLGLATVYGIVIQNKGHISVYSEKGKGTEIKVFWPLLIEGKVEFGQKKEEKAKGGNELILVVEDEESVRRITINALKKLGYKTLEAQGGEEAFNMVTEYEGKIDMIFTDLVMPGIGGDELAAKVNELYPGVKVLLTSGYSRNVFSDGESMEKHPNFIRKPFSYKNLGEKIRSLLDKES